MPPSAPSSVATASPTPGMHYVLAASGRLLLGIAGIESISSTQKEGDIVWEEVRGANSAPAAMPARLLVCVRTCWVPGRASEGEPGAVLSALLAGAATSLLPGRPIREWEWGFAADLRQEARAWAVAAGLSRVALLPS